MDYRTKLQLAEQMIKEVLGAGLAFESIVFHTHYTAGWLTKVVGRLGFVGQGTLNPRTVIIRRGKRLAVSKLAEMLRVKWRKSFGVRAVALRIFAPKYGEMRLVVTRNSHGNYEYIDSNDISADLNTLAKRKRSRWSIETIFCYTKQLAGLEACHCWADQAMIRHLTLAMMTFVVFQMMRARPEESVGAIKEW